MYISDDGDILALRYDNWKVVFMEQRCKGTMQVWAEPFVTTAAAQALQSADRPLRVRGHHVEHLLRVVHPARLHRLRDHSIARKFAETFKDFPPIQKPNTFTIDDAIGKMRDATAGG